MKQNKNSHSQSGVAIFYILLAIALFAALSFAFTQNMNNANTNALTEEEAKVYAQDILAYANRLDRGVQKVMSRGICSENDISFYLASNAALSGYIHAPVSADTCRVFENDGGNISWQAPAPEINDGTNWVFSGHNRIALVENDVALTGNDLVAFLPNINQQICIELNQLLDVTNPSDAPPIENDDVLYTAFTGTFASNTYVQTAGGELDRKTSGCFEANQIDSVNAPDTFHFYHVLIAR